MQAPLASNSTPSRFIGTLIENGRFERPTVAEQDEVLRFLNRRPVHGAYLAGIIRDNGLNSYFNRGAFYTYRNDNNEIEGVALIGHAIMVETASDEALRAFASTARRHKQPHLIICEEARLDKFWSYYARSEETVRSTHRELLLELRWPVADAWESHELRPATANDLEMLLPVHARMACEESGIDPRDTDMHGFTERYARRIQQGRTWLLMQDDQLIFKAEVVTQTPQTSYLEGVWIHPDVRRQDYGRRCMNQLAQMLMWRSRSICLFVNAQNQRAREFYKQCGYNHRATYKTIFLK